MKKSRDRRKGVEGCKTLLLVSPKINFWAHFARAINLAPIDVADKVSLVGMVRSRSLKTMEDLLDQRLSRAQQETDPSKYYAYASIKAIYSKYEGAASQDSSDTALSTWMKAERCCRRANRRLRLTKLGLIGKNYSPIIEKARGIVAHVLGKIDFDEIASSCKHGPGVAIGVAGLATSGAFKYASSEYTVSPACATIFRDMVLTDHTWHNLVFRNQTKLAIVDDCDKLAFVPKNWKTMRSISIGPSGNIYTQLGIGVVLANRLKRVGIDLEDQENNQRAAYEASSGTYEDFGCSYATLDLSMASDTLCRELVSYLLPDDWFRLLDATRTSQTMLPDGSKVRLHKFSAMGNGFTFPLETLCFYALSQACVSFTRHKRKIWVYGDDIIVPKGSALLVTELLRWCGFSVNTEKSYYHGSFYESCGADYLGGVPVRPVYWKRDLRSDRDFYVLINSYAEHLSDVPSRSWLDNLRDYLLRCCSNTILYGPSVRGTARQVIDDRVVTSDRSLYTLRVRNSITQCKVFRTAPVFRDVLDDFAYLQARHGLRRGHGCILEQRFTADFRSSPGSLDSKRRFYKRVSTRSTHTSGTLWISVS